MGAMGCLRSEMKSDHAASHEKESSVVPGRMVSFQPAFQKGLFVNLPSHTHTEDYWAKEWFCLFLKVYSQHSPIWRGPLDMLSTAQRPGPGFNLYPCFVFQNNCRGRTVPLPTGSYQRTLRERDRVPRCEPSSSLMKTLLQQEALRWRNDASDRIFPPSWCWSRGWQEGSPGCVFPIADSN